MASGCTNRLSLHDRGDNYLDARRLRRSIVVTSNRVIQDWGKYLGDNTTATTILDRLMHHAAMLEFEGKSYRLKEAAARIARGTSHDA